MRHSINIITGRLSSGKSTVARILRENGCHVIDLDFVFTDILQHDPVARTLLNSRFGVNPTNELGEMHETISEKLINDFDTYAWVWRKLSNRIIPVLEEVMGLLILGGETFFIELPVIYPWLNNWLLQYMNVQEFHISVTDDNERLERRVKEFVKKKELVVDFKPTASILLFHSKEEIERNKKLVIVYRSILDIFDSRQRDYEEAGHGVDTLRHDFLNDDETAPAIIASKILEEVG